MRKIKKSPKHDKLGMFRTAGQEMIKSVDNGQESLVADHKCDYLIKKFITPIAIQEK